MCLPIYGQTVAPGWVHEHWTTADGLPVNSVNAVVQGEDGYIWLATYDGLVRFDGVRFTVFNAAGHPNLPTNRFLELVETDDGALWLLSEQWQLIRFQGNQFTVFDREEGLPHDMVYELRLDSDGSLLIGTAEGAARYKKGRVERLAPDIVVGAVLSFLRGPDNALWIGTDDGVFRLGSDGEARRVLSAGALQVGAVESLALVDGVLWIGGTVAGVSVLENGDVRALPGAEALARESVFSIVAQGDTVWLRTYEGVYGYRAGQIVHRPKGNEGYGPQRQVGRMVWTSTKGARWVNTKRRLLRNGRTIFRSDAVLFPVTMDREGNLWIPAEDGLHRLYDSPFTAYREVDGLRSENIYPILETAGGAIWLGTRGGGLARLHDGVIRTYGPEANVPVVVWALEDAGDGALWVGGESGSGLCRFRNGTCREDGIPDAILRSPVRAIHRRADGSTWVGTPEGLYRLENGEWQRFTSEDGVPRQVVRVFLEGEDDSLWMGTNGGGIIRYKDGVFTTFTTADGLCSDLVRALHLDSHGGLWVGTEDRGLCRVEMPNGDLSGATVTQIDREDGLYDHGVHRILDDGMGRLWMSGNRGIWWVTKDDLDTFVAGERDRIRSTAYTERNGLPTREANGGMYPAGIRASDGRLWFPTQNGAVVFDPTELPRNELRPPVHIEEVVVGSGDNRRVLTGSEMPDQLTLGSDERRLEIAYTAPSFLDPGNVRFRYRLEGVDEDWVEAGNRRLATYANLRPGPYRFQVIAANADGVWNETGAAFDMRVRPTWYETRTFLVLCALLLMAVGLAVGLWRRRESERRRQELEAQVDERTEELSDALATVGEQAAALEELDKAKSRFFANISHEFRTPLTVILGGLKDAVAGRLGKDPEKRAEQHQAMLRNTRRLQNLIDEVLDLNRLESGKLALDPAPGDLSRFLEGLVEANAPLAERNDVNLTFEAGVEHCPRRYDAEKLEKIVGNLLSNALKFTPKGGSVRVNLRCGEETEISVADDGPGIPAEEQEKIFERFAQAGRGALRGGTGIGLALANELAELHGGTIALESEPGEGSTFSVRLPLETAPLYAVAEASQPAPGSDQGDVAIDDGEGTPTAGGMVARQNEEADDDPDRTTVLVIEDNDDVRTYVRRSLEETYRVLEAADGEEGMEQARAALPDLIVSDIMLPGIDGYEVARRLKADPDTECIPVVMLTARAAEEDHVTGYGAGAEAYITKPFSPETLRAALARLLEERRRLRRRLQEEQEEAEEGEPLNGHRSFHDRARAAVLEHIHDGDFGVDELADALHISRPTLYRRLNEDDELSPGSLIQSVRIKKAHALLSNGAGSVSEVAYAVGFKSLSHFARIFRGHYGTLPSTVLEAKE